MFIKHEVYVTNIISTIFVQQEFRAKQLKGKPTRRKCDNYKGILEIFSVSHKKLKARTQRFLIYVFCFVFV